MRSAAYHDAARADRRAAHRALADTLPDRSRHARLAPRPRRRRAGRGRRCGARRGGRADGAAGRTDHGGTVLGAGQPAVAPADGSRPPPPARRLGPRRRRDDRRRWALARSVRRRRGRRPRRGQPGRAHQATPAALPAAAVERGDRRGGGEPAQVGRRGRRRGARTSPSICSSRRSPPTSDPARWPTSPAPSRRPCCCATAWTTTGRAASTSCSVPCSSRWDGSTASSASSGTTR